tara:strand:+ start:95 stop:394 length:300 start_codon:yes stop_codon:yes gene_type:complete
MADKPKNGDHKPMDERARRWLELAIGVATVLGVVVIVLVTTLGNVSRQVDVLRVRQDNADGVQREQIAQMARFNALQEDVREELVKIDNRLQRIEDKLP